MIKKIIPKRIKDFSKIKIKKIINGSEFSEISNSHCGEDRILRYLFKKRKNGFYIDVGAFHPMISSNTFIFYENNWKGINIDAFPAVWICSKN